MDYLARTPEARAALISRSERFRSSGRFGGLEARQLSSILHALDRGDLQHWADLCEFALATDAHLLSVHTTRVARVAQAEHVIKPNKFGDQRLAALAAEFMNEQVGRCENWTDTIKNMMNAVTPGVSANEMRWDDDRVTRTKFVSETTFIPAHRFHYDEQWNLRIYDQGMQRSKSSFYGALLDPRLWIVHTHTAQSGYPNLAGVFRSCVYDWMFRRWADVFWIQYLEKFGTPFMWGEVVENAQGNARAEMLAGMENFANTHAAVIEKGGVIHIESAGTQSGASEIHEKYQLAKERNITKAYLGSSDAVDPGKNGSNAAVSTRLGATMDPSMVADGMTISSTMQRTFFKWSLRFNMHKFGGQMPPIPEMSFKTASDEVKTDVQDLQDQSQPGSQQSVRVKETPGQLPQITIDDKPPADDTAPMPEPHSQAPAPELSANDPKAPRCPAHRTSSSQTATTSPTTSRSLGALDRVLLGRSVDPAR